MGGCCPAKYANLFGVSRENQREIEGNLHREIV